MRFLKRGLLFVFLFGVCPDAEAAPHVHDWSQQFGDASSQQSNSIAVDASGNSVVTGWFMGTVDFGGGILTSAGGSDVFLAKFDPGGNNIWSQRFGDASGQVANKVTVDPFGNVIVTGYFQGTVNFGGGVLTSAGSNDIFVAKFDASGNHLWSQSFGDASDQQPFDVECDGLGNVVVTGHFEGTVDFGGGLLTNAGGKDIFVAKFYAAGSHMWSQRFGDAADQYGIGVETDGSGNALVTGYFLSTVDFGGGVLVSGGSFDTYIVKFDAGGTHLWSQRFGDTNSDLGEGVAADGSNNVILAGRFVDTIDFGGGVLTSSGSQDVFLAKFDASGTHLWSQRFGDTNQDVNNAVAVDGSGNIVITGQDRGLIDFGGGPLLAVDLLDGYVAKFDAGGNHMWSRRLGGTNNETPRDICTDGSGHIFVAGYFAVTIDVGGGVMTGAGGNDIFVVKYLRTAPEIHSVRDVPGDQGGLVNLAWYGSGVDTPSEPEITQYTVWRAISATMAAALIADGALSSSMPPVDLDDAWDRPFIRVDKTNGAPFFWYLVETIPAFYLPGYSAPVATLFDSTSVSSENHYFQVIAHTSVPTTFYTSDPDTGYSVDNLAPAMPMSLVGIQNQTPVGLELTWDANTESDLGHYAVYRGVTPDFVPGPGNLIASPDDPTIFDSGWTWAGGYYYKVSAIDEHENESDFAILGPNQATGIGEDGIPRATYLLQNVPNPFNPETQITFGLREAGNVSLQIFDASGRLVRELVSGHRNAGPNEATWKGVDQNGLRVGSGVYFYRLEVGGEIRTRKLVFLK